MITVMLDINVVMDVAQQRQPHYQYSSIVISEVLYHHINGLLAGHAITTLYYLITKYRNRHIAEQKVDWLLEHFAIASPDAGLFRQARTLPMQDFEDAVIAVLAKHAGCDYILTRNIPDFTHSPIQPITPEEFVRTHITLPVDADEK